MQGRRRHAARFGVGDDEFCRHPLSQMTWPAYKPANAHTQPTIQSGLGGIEFLSVQAVAVALDQVLELDARQLKYRLVVG